MFLLEKGSWLLSLCPEGGSYHPVLVYVGPCKQRSLGKNGCPGMCQDPLQVHLLTFLSRSHRSLFWCCSPGLSTPGRGAGQSLLSPSLIPWASPGTWITRQRQAALWPPHQWCLATKMQLCLCLSFPSVPFGVFWLLQGDWAGNSPLG